MHPPGKSFLIVGVLALWFSIAGFLCYDRTDLADDLAEYVNNPVRLLHGERPYRDFWLLHPPGEVFLPAAIYQFGFGVNAVLLVSVGISVLAGLAAFWVGRLSSGRDLEGVLAALLVFFAGVPFENMGYVYLHAYLLFLLAAAGLLAGYLRDHRHRYLFVAGLTVGIGFLFRIYLTGAAAAALFATVLLEARGRKCSWKEIAGLLAICGSGILLVIAGISMWLSDLLPVMWHAVAVDSVSHAITRRLAYGHFIVDSWTEFIDVVDAFVLTPASAGAFYAVAVRGSDLVKTVTMHGVPFLAVYFWWFRRRNCAAGSEPTDWMVLFFLLWGSLTFIRSFTRGGHAHQLSQAATPLYFVLVLLLRPIVVHWRATRAIGAGLVAWAALGTVAGVAHRAVAVTGQRAAVTFLGKYFPVAAPYGTLVLNDRSASEELQGLISAVLEHTAEEDCLFVVPWSAPALYALTRRRNPTYYDSTIDLFYRPTAEKQRQVCDALLAKETKLIIGRADLPGAGWDSIGNRTRLPIIDACIEDHYERISEIGRFCVYRRRAPKTGSAAERTDGSGP